MHAKLTHALFIPSLLGEMAAFLVTSRRWWDKIDDQIIVGALPFKRHVPQLHDLGVRQVVNMCSEYRGPTTTYEGFGIEQLRLPTLDFHQPALSDVLKAIQFVERGNQAGGRTYLHCKAGRGRSAAVAVCWLMAKHGKSSIEAEEWLIHCRSHVNRRLRESDIVCSFADHLKQQS